MNGGLILNLKCAACLICDIVYVRDVGDSAIYQVLNVEHSSLDRIVLLIYGIDICIVRDAV